MMKVSNESITSRLDGLVTAETHKEFDAVTALLGQIEDKKLRNDLEGVIVTLSAQCGNVAFRLGWEAAKNPALWIFEAVK